ncbi:MAG: LytTR family DNA-binding domain-containing protein, partial [Balneolales bacterium]
MLNVILIDDEQLARRRMQMLLDELDQNIHVIAEASNGKEAIELIRKHKPDLIFLDIQMPVLDGFDVVDLLSQECPPVIFVTAYDEYALKAFEVHAVDYLLKPVRKERLKKALEKTNNNQHMENQFQAIRQLLQVHTEQTQQKVTKLPVNHKNEILMLDFHRISFLEADGKLTWVHTTENKKYRTDFSFTELENRLKNYSFLRIHRSHIVNLEEVKKLEPWFNHGYRLQMNTGAQLEVARRRTGE